MTGRPWHRCVAIALALLIGALPVQAEDAEIPVNTVELQDAGDGSESRFALLEGNADALGERFTVEDTALLEPISITVTTPKPRQRIRLRVVKGDWDAPLRDLKTDDDGRVQVKFRTYGGFDLMVSADRPTDYRIEIRIDREQPAELSPAVVPASIYKAAAANGSGAGMQDKAGSPGWKKIVTILVLLTIAGGGAALWTRHTRNSREST